MKREDIEASAKIDPLGKLVLEWLSRAPARVHTSREIGDALGVISARIAEESSSLRVQGFCLRHEKERSLPLAELLLADHVRQAYLSSAPRKDLTK